MFYHSLNCVQDAPTTLHFKGHQNYLSPRVFFLQISLWNMIFIYDISPHPCIFHFLLHRLLLLLPPGCWAASIHWSSLLVLRFNTAHVMQHLCHRCSMTVDRDCLFVSWLPRPEIITQKLY